MTHRIYAVAILCSLVLLVVPSVAQSDFETIERIAAEAKMRLIKSMLQNQDVAISFYGKVIDQNDIPISEASVEIQISQFNPDMEKLFGQVKTIIAQTDSVGLFSIEKEKGSSIYVKGISKGGYEHINPGASFQYGIREGHTQKPFIPDKNLPIIFHMRKKGPMVFCIKDIGGLRLGTGVEGSGRPFGYDFIRHYPITDMQNLVLNDEPVTCDLQVKGTFNTTWSVVLSSGTTNGGIIVSTQLLYEAPEAGYQPDHTFTPKNGDQVPAMYIYLKSRDPAIYTRLKIRHINANEEFFSLNGEYVTNPYGGRNLEPATDLPYEVIKQLTDEVKLAYRQNQRPTEPDLIKQFLPAQVRLEPEVLKVSPGILTAFVRLPDGYPASGITSATCDGAPTERMMLNKNESEMIMKFRRRDIEEIVLRPGGGGLDTYFVIRGVWQGATGTNFFLGTARIKKIVAP